MNVFELLKHENHILEVVHLQNEVLLGCINCGCTLASTSENIQHFHDEFIRYKDVLIEKGYDNILSSIDLFEKEILKFTHELTKKYIEKKVYAYVEDEFHNSDDPELGVWFDLYSFLFDEGRLYDSIIDGFECEYIENLYSNHFDDFKEELIDIAYDRLAQDNSNILLLPGQTYVVSNNIIKGSANSIVILDKRLVEKMETENPTVTDVLTFENEEDFKDYAMTDDNTIELKYRVANGLIDISNLDKGKIVNLLEKYGYYSKYVCLLKLFEK